MPDYRKYLPMDDTLFDYVLEHTSEPDAVQRDLIDRTNGSATPGACRSHIRRRCS